MFLRCDFSIFISLFSHLFVHHVAGSIPWVFLSFVMDYFIFFNNEVEKYQFLQNPTMCVQGPHGKYRLN